MTAWHCLSQATCCHVQVHSVLHANGDACGMFAMPPTSAMLAMLANGCPQETKACPPDVNHQFVGAHVMSSEVVIVKRKERPWC